MVLENTLMIGAHGLLGTELVKLMNSDGQNIFTPSHEELSIESMDSIERYCLNKKIDTILNLAAYTSVLGSYEKEGSIESISTNVIGVSNLVIYSIKNDIRLIQISTDAVFDGKEGGYNPSDKINPISNYGRTKAAAELSVMCHENSKIIRTSFIDNHFPYEYALEDQYTSRDYLHVMAPLIYEEIVNFERSTIVHVGTERKTMLELAMKTNKNIQSKKTSDLNFKVPLDNSFGTIRRCSYA